MSDDIVSELIQTNDMQSAMIDTLRADNDRLTKENQELKMKINELT